MGQSISSEWEQIHSNRAWGKYPSEPVIRFVARNFYEGDRKNTRILDFGCGQGAHTWYLAREGFDVYAFDGSPSAVKKAKETLEKENLSAKFKIIDGVNIDYEENFFDAVIDSACVGCALIDDIKTMYSKIFTILKPGGYVFSSYFSVNTSGYGTGEKLEHNTYKNVTEGPVVGEGVIHFWEKDEFNKVITDAGFEDVKIDTVTYTDNGNLIELFILTGKKVFERKI